ncbi:MAG: MOP flippase family protein [Deltaproteobacteria bacterium]|nr:MOP flippase family protein [Deltaproteobacteria bacterium]
MVVAVVGDVSFEQARRAAEKHLGRLKASGRALRDPRPEASFTGARSAVLRVDKSQAHLVIGFLGTTITSRDRHALELLNALLSGQSGRLFMELRDRRHLAYSVTSFNHEGQEPGAFGLYIGTSPDRVDEARRGIWEQVLRLRDELVPAAELESAKRYLVGAAEIDMAHLSTVAQSMALDELLGLSYKEPFRVARRMEGITPERLRDVARRYLRPDAFAEALVTPPTTARNERRTSRGHGRRFRNLPACFADRREGDVLDGRVVRRRDVLPDGESGRAGALSSPGDFGLMGMANVVIGLSGGLAQLGLSNAIIQRENIRHEQLSSLYWANLGSSLLTAALLWAVVPLVVMYYREPRVAPVLYWMAAIFTVQAVGQQFIALLQRHFEFRMLAIVEIVGSIVGLGIGVVMAVQGFGVFALVGSQLGQMAARTIFLCAIGWRRWRPRLHFRWADLSGFIRFGLYQTGERTINLLAANVDYLIIGRFFGETALGFYVIAYQLATLPLHKINPVLARFALPVMSRLQNDPEKVQDTYQRILQAVAVINGPLLLGLYLTAEPAVITLVGPQWGDAVPSIRALAVMGFLKCLINPGGAVLLAKDRADIGFWQNVGAALSNALVFYAAIHISVLTLAWSYSALKLLEFVFIVYIVRRLVGFNMARFVGYLKLPGAALLVLAVVTVAADYVGLTYFGAARWPSSARLGLLVLVGGAGYVATLLALDRALVLSSAAAFLKARKEK